MSDTTMFLNSLDACIEQHKMLNHPFYQTWTMGKLTREALGVCKTVLPFRPGVSDAKRDPREHAATLRPSGAVENLTEEERGAGNHRVCGQSSPNHSG
jgi:hypothetical protein